MMETKNAKEWLKNKYKNKNEVEKIEFEVDTHDKGIELEGDLKIDRYPQLEKIDLREGKGITELIVESCDKVREIRVYDNKISKIEGLEKLPELTYLGLSKNQISGRIDISKNTKLEYLNLQGNPDTAEI